MVVQVMEAAKEIIDDLIKELAQETVNAILRRISQDELKNVTEQLETINIQLNRIADTLEAMYEDKI